MSNKLNGGITEWIEATEKKKWKESLTMNLRSIFQKMAVFGSSRRSQLGSSLLDIFRKFKVLIKSWIQTILQKTNEWVRRMVGPIEKGVQAAQMTKPPEGVYEGVDLRTLPRFICFKAAVMRQKVMHTHVCIILAVVLIAHYLVSRVEISNLHGMLRAKEYILAPGVHDFTPASAQSVPDTYVSNAVTEFVGLLGNVNAGTIEDQYKALEDNMSPQLRIKFQTEARSWKNKVKNENIAELVNVRKKEIVQNGSGYYKVTALARRQTYIDNEYAGHSDEVIEMVMQLIPPKIGKRWYLQINQLTRNSQDTFKARKTYQTGS